MSAEQPPSEKTPSGLSSAEPSPTTTATSPYSQDSAFLRLALLLLNTKCARLRKGLYLPCPRSANNEGDAPMCNVIYNPSQSWTMLEVWRFNAGGEMPKVITEAGTAESIWLLPWACSMDQFPVMDLDDLPDSENQRGFVYLARGEREVKAFGGVEKIIGVGMGRLKLVEIGGGQGRLEFKEKGTKLDGFGNLAQVE